MDSARIFTTRRECISIYYNLQKKNNEAKTFLKQFGSIAAVISGKINNSLCGNVFHAMNLPNLLEWILPDIFHSIEIYNYLQAFTW